MSSKTQNNGQKRTPNGVIDRALNVGLAKAAAEGRAVTAEVRLDESQEKMVMELCNVLGLSARAVLNAAIRFLLYYARLRGTPPTRVREYPKHLSGRLSTFELTAETLGQAQEAAVLDVLPHCVVAGVKLLHGRVLNVKTRR
jgi:hypothetical protein